MPRRDGMDLDDLSHEMARVLRNKKCRHHFEGYVEMGQLARYLRVPYNDVAAVVGAKHRDDDELYFNRVVHEGKVWLRHGSRTEVLSLKSSEWSGCLFGLGPIQGEASFVSRCNLT